VRTIGLSLLVVAGCVDAFPGSNVQIDFAAGTPVQVAPGGTPGTGQLPSNVHFTFYAFQEDAMNGRLFAVQDFEIHPIVDLASPCYIDVGEHVEHPGLHVSQYEKVIDQDVGIPDYTMPPAGASEIDKEKAATAHQRMDNIDKLLGSTSMPMYVISSASPAEYDPAMVDTGCTDTSKIPAPTCTDEDSNKRRLAMCQAFWKGHPGFYEGTDRVLTAPLSGTMHGLVDGNNAINLAPVGGSQFFVDEALDGFDGYAIYWQFDDADGDGQPDYPAGFPDADKHPAGQLLLFGNPTMVTRDVIHTHLTSRLIPGLTAELAIFANLDQDSTHF
jgi:hypothetical protein